MSEPVRNSEGDTENCQPGGDSVVSKKGLKKQAKEAEKAAKKQQKQEQVSASADSEASAEDCSAGRYGNLPMIQSRDKPERTLVSLKELTGGRAGQTVGSGEDCTPAESLVSSVSL